MLKGAPRNDGVCLDPQLLVQFAHQRGFDTLTHLELAPRELPITGVGLAIRPLRQQEAAVGAYHDANRDLCHRAGGRSVCGN